ncbi:isoleucyl-tRNA synthetase [Pelomyxa schiedti]|nr:isoleucyl-tRNA synthetase [Pelomyxa schiedti]
MQSVPDKINFAKEEQKTQEFWDRVDVFNQCLKRNEGLPQYSFYDGPPFATGTPHYGHILAGTIKDTVTRYAHQTGHHVIRRFGWDTHGLPIEFEIDKLLGIKCTDEVLKFGIPKYNAECRAIVMRYSEEWKVVVKRMGRWIDMDHPYKTMDLSFMESVWWVFWRLWKLGLVYRGFKVMPFSTACATPLSNFEANMQYRDVSDPAIYLTMPLESEPEVSLLVWTTTPWTLPSNLGVCVNASFDYVKIKDEESGQFYIVGEPLLPSLPYKARMTVIEKFKGSTLVGKFYIPLFDYFKSERASHNAFRIVADPYVTNDSGTGLVHMAPAFGEDDFRVCLDNGIISKGETLVCPVDNNGRFTAEVTEFAGVYVKDADKDIMHLLKQKGRVFFQGTKVHSYPFCWRSDTPLIYKAVPSWFVAVEKIKENLLLNNKKTYWVPEFVQEKRFHNWLESAHDWAVSRNRFWGTPLPIWISDDGQEVRVIGSVEKLNRLSGLHITDLHRENVDDVKIPSKKNPGTFLHRVPEVFDCWFESGSMPYGQMHYPFENKELFEASFPADFIAEGIDQTRGWFYTLLVLSTALFNKPPFKNLIVNGLVLASDGKKMSKRLKNYPDPVLIADRYGADALRLYLINSPVVRGDSLKFQEKGVRELLAQVFLPWFNAYRFLAQNSTNYQKMFSESFSPDLERVLASGNIMDKWILSETQSLIKFVRVEMEHYRLYTVVPKFVDFISTLTNWYVRLNRQRIKGVFGKEDAILSMSTLFHVLVTLCRAGAPFTPFFVEYLYQGLCYYIPASERQDSVHYCSFPEPLERAINPVIEGKLASMMNVISLCRIIRDKRNCPVKYPLQSLSVVTHNKQFLNALSELEPYIQSELNIKELVLTSDEGKFVHVRVEADRAKLGKRLRKDMAKVLVGLAALSTESVREFQATGSIVIEGHKLTLDDVQIFREFKGDTKKQEAVWEKDVLLVLNLEVDESMKAKGLAREVTNKIQKLRKRSGVDPLDPVDLFYAVSPADSCVANAISSEIQFISNTLGFTPLPLEHKPQFCLVIGQETSDLKGENAKLQLVLTCRQFGLSKTVPEDVAMWVASRNYYQLRNTLNTHGSCSIRIGDNTNTLTLGQNIFPTVKDAVGH